ncbi:MAG: hypothetical protein ACFNM8_06775 [Prevotella histicola]|uniref:hypothetical protein n=1 Tax=Prevotella histicola TaxID=470565 RepID=UPI003605EB9C
MKKIMFSDDYCLTQAVLDGTKTMTRRLLKVPKTCNGKEVYSFNILTNNAGAQCVDLVDENGGVLGSWKPHYEVGEIVAIAQDYNTIGKTQYDKFGNGVPGNRNKMFTRAELLPHHIQITDVKVERLQDISDKECLREGVKRASIGFYAEGVKVKDWEKEAHRETASGCLKLFPFPRPAFASLIDKISGKGTWESNPWVVAYSFELVD